MMKLLGKIICIDFDGTIVDYYGEGETVPMPRAFEVIKRIKDAGATIVLWTCREDERNRKYLTDAVNFCKANGVEFDHVNETPVEIDFRPDYVKRRKPYCAFFIDDRNIGGFIGWDKVEELLFS